MNKEQEKIAENVISILKNNNGMLAEQMVMNNVNGYNDNRHIVIRGLKELQFIDSVSSSYILTIKGYNFKSFSDLRMKKLIKKFKKNISFIISILLGFLTIYLSIVNTNLSDGYRDVSVQLEELKAELHQLDVQTKNHLYQHEISLSDTIK